MKIGKALFLSLSAVVLTFIVTTTPVHAGKYGMAGCGLGSIIIKDNNFLQIFAVTTNGTYYNQSFGITSGTSNCTADGVVKLEKVQELFVTVNYDSLGQELATGNGEKLESFGNLLGCSADSMTRFKQITKDKYSRIVSEDSTPSSVLAAVKSEVKSDKILSQSCTQI